MTPPRSSSYGRRPPSVARRETLWLFLDFASVVLGTAATANLTGSLNAVALALRPFTIVRTHLQWLCKSDQSAASESFVGNVGMAVVSDQAVAVGVTAIPTPATDRGSDMFFLHSAWPGRFDLIGTDVTQDLQHRNIDSKAMRKVNDDSDLVLTTEAGLIGSGVSITIGGRILIKTH